MDSNQKSVKTKKKSKAKRNPPFVLPNSSGNELMSRLKYWTSTCNAFKWSQNNINNKTKKFLSRNGFHMLFWSALIIDERIKTLIDEIFADNILYICDNDFEANFGIAVDTNAIISVDQLLANYFLLFSLPAKSQTQYVYEWTQRRLDAWSEALHRPKLAFDAHQELFIETKRRFYVYKPLVPALTRFVLNSFQSITETNLMKELFRQIKIAISYSGLQVFYLSWIFMNWNRKAMDLESVKEDIKRITDGRNTLVEKYGEDMLPFARLLNYPEVNQLNRRNYPDLAVCAKYVLTEERNTLAFLKFRKMKTKTPIDQLKRAAVAHKPFEFKPFTDEDKATLISLGLFPDWFHTLSVSNSFTNPFDDFDFNP